MESRITKSAMPNSITTATASFEILIPNLDPLMECKDPTVFEAVSQRLPPDEQVSRLSRIFHNGVSTYEQYLAVADKTQSSIFHALDYVDSEVNIHVCNQLQQTLYSIVSHVRSIGKELFSRGICAHSLSNFNRRRAQHAQWIP